MGDHESSQQVLRGMKVCYFRYGQQKEEIKASWPERSIATYDHDLTKVR